MTHHYQYIQINRNRPVIQLSINRPDQHNALIPELIQELDKALDEISVMDEIFFLVLCGKGHSFCTGADMNWLAGAKLRSLEQNAAHYEMFAQLLLKLYQIPQVTIALARGNVFGGGIGLMAACDFVLAESHTRFMFSEVKRGLLPATILPFISKRLSVQKMRHWMLTGKLFTAPEALEAGLVDLMAEEDRLEPTLYDFIASFNEASPAAMRKAKKMINQVASGNINVKDTDLTSTTLAVALLSPDGQEGIHSFLEKRKPQWKDHTLHKKNSTLKFNP
ncbi:MAG TPA: enoyl-CoA hydratase-related protein [Prolixibacteraceae bacterium]|nr:enoyl-CoA hydratase-related protein [Prolixibacteraceae bacterium]